MRRAVRRLPTDRNRPGHAYGRRIIYCGNTAGRVGHLIDIGTVLAFALGLIALYAVGWLLLVPQMAAAARMERPSGRRDALCAQSGRRPLRRDDRAESRDRADRGNTGRSRRRDDADHTGNPLNQKRNLRGTAGTGTIEPGSGIPRADGTLPGVYMYASLEGSAISCPVCLSAVAEPPRGVPGEGSGADLMFVGEGPGAEEDLAGRPFVGAADNCWTAYWKPSTLRAAMCYRQYRQVPPARNRNPTGEAEACLPWLRHQVRLIRPRIIVCLGTVAAREYHRPGRARDEDPGPVRQSAGDIFCSPPTIRQRCSAMSGR